MYAYTNNSRSPTLKYKINDKQKVSERSTRHSKRLIKMTFVIELKNKWHGRNMK